MSRPHKKPALALDTDLVQDNMPQEIVHNIYIGSIHAAFNQEALSKAGITHILNASRIPATFPKNFTYFSIDIRDKDESNILSCIPSSNIFIEAGVDAGGVLVHCFGGRSRSAALVSAYLMSSRNWTMEKALAVITAARPVACINKGFDRQLSAYMCTNYDVYAAQQVLLLNRVHSLRHIRRALDTNSRKEKEGPDTSSPSSSGVNKRDRQTSLGSSMDLDEEAANGPNQGLGLRRVEDPEQAGVKGTSPGGTNNGGNGNGDGNVFRQDGAAVGAGAEASSTGGDRIMISAATTQPLLPPAASSSSSSSIDESFFPLPISEGCAPNCRLTRPGSTSVRVIPPLRGLERRYGCIACGKSLFALANVIREDMDLAAAIEETLALQKKRENAASGIDITRMSPRGQGQEPRPGPGPGQRPDLFDHRSSDSLVNMSGRDEAKEAFRGQHAGISDAKGPGGPGGTGGDEMDVDSVAPVTSRHAQAKVFFGDDASSELEGGDMDVSQTPVAAVRGPMSARETRIAFEDDSGGGFSSITVVNPDASAGSRDSSLRLGPGSGKPCSLQLPMGTLADGGGGLRRERPQSAEKRRWLARVSLLKADAKESISRAPDVPDAKSAKLAAQDDDVVESVQEGHSQHLFLEYLEWMGREPLSGADEGGLHCPSCKKVLGRWSWGGETDSEAAGPDGVSSRTGDNVGYAGPHTLRASTHLNPPLFAVWRDTVQLAYMPLDQTPNATPRPSDSTEETPRTSRTDSKDGDSRPNSGSATLSARARSGSGASLLLRPSSGTSRPSSGAK